MTLRTLVEEQANRIVEQTTLIEKLRAEMTVLLARLSSNSQLVQAALVRRVYQARTKVALRK